MYRIVFLTIVIIAGNAAGEAAHSLVDQGNQLYVDGQFEPAIEKYVLAVEKAPTSGIPEFNKGNSLYRLENFEKAIESYKQAAAGSSDREIVAAAKYNLGNSFLQKALKNQQTEPEKTLEDIKTSIGFYRDALNIAPNNLNAAGNIEVAKTTYKQIKEQQQQQEQQQQENQEGDSEDKEQQDQQQQQSQDGDKQDKDKQQQGDQQQQEQQQDQQESEQQQGQEPKEQPMAPDATAQQILDKEKQQKKERQILQSSGLQKVEKDW